MEYNLRSLTDAFDDSDYVQRRREFGLFAFLLATPADTNVLPGLLPHLFELDD